MHRPSVEKIEFEPLTSAHMDLLHDWFHVPHVKKWYAREQDYTLQDIKKKYLPRLSDKYIDSYVTLVNQEPIGYIQIYYLPRHLPENLALDVINRNTLIEVNNTAGLDVFFAKNEYIGKGICSQVLSKFLKLLIPDDIENVIVDPLKANTKAILFFERNEFHKTNFIPETDNCYLVRKLS